MTDNPEIISSSFSTAEGALTTVYVNGNAGTVTMPLFVYDAILDTIAVLQEQVEARELEIRKQDESMKSDVE